jgi:hypothetical protein
MEYTCIEASAFLGISPRRVRALAAGRRVGTKRLRAKRLRWCFTDDDVEAMRVRVPGRPRNPKPPKSVPPAGYVTLRHAATVAGLSLHAVRQAAYRGKLPVLRVDNLRTSPAYIAPSDLANGIRHCHIRPTPSCVAWLRTQPA